MAKSKKNVQVFCDVNVQIPLSIQVEVEDIENLKQDINDSINFNLLIPKLLKDKFDLIDCVNARVLKSDVQYLDLETNTWKSLQENFLLNHNGGYPKESPWKNVELEDVVQLGEYVYVKEDAYDAEFLHANYGIRQKKEVSDGDL